ncbi:MAG: DUF2284 domain-containing protein [Synergistaceae bacterium]|nr:DUF2284 domain-containing protein [Synergistaceae bacterium]
MFDKAYKTKIHVKNIAVKEFLTPKYYRSKEIRTACCACPYYDKIWSCPPSSSVASDVLFGKTNGFLVAVQVYYEPYLIRVTQKLNEKQKDILRLVTYGRVKRILNNTCLALEGEFDGGVSIAAGVCENCEICAKQEEKACRFPQKMRYSFSGIGLDLVKLSRDFLGLEILWSKDSFPEYETLVAGIFY